jgi:urocanate hydratase
MPCDTKLAENQTLTERTTQIDAALKRLEAALLAGRVSIGIAGNGAVAFKTWNDRDGVSDVCAYRTLASGNSWALRQAVAKAEALSGRKVNPHAVAAGHHSHDGGKSWHPGH